MKAGLNLHVDSNQEPDTSRPLLLAPLERDVVWVGRGAAAQPVVEAQEVAIAGPGHTGGGPHGHMLHQAVVQARGIWQLQVEE